MLISLSGCATNNRDALNIAAALAAEASLVDSALAAQQVQAPMQPMPFVCGRKTLSGVTSADRLDAALLKTDAALSSANGEKLDCYQLANRKIEIANRKTQQ